VPPDRNNGTVIKDEFEKNMKGKVVEGDLRTNL
jgi:hypothetical protein